MTRAKAGAAVAALALLAWASRPVISFFRGLSSDGIYEYLESIGTEGFDFDV